jgi:hypothetical protein
MAIRKHLAERSFDIRREDKSVRRVSVGEGLLSRLEELLPMRDQRLPYYLQRTYHECPLL